MATIVLGSSHMTKKRFYEIQRRFQDVNVTNEAMINQFLQIIKDVLSFDPNVSTYTPELGKKTKEYRNRLRSEQGISTYITSGRKKQYETMKKHDMLAV